MDTMNIGLLTMAFGADKYLRQAETLAMSIRRNMPGYKIAIVTDRADPGPLFDIVVPMRPVLEAGTVLKTDMYDYSPFEETFFIDSDCVVARDFTPQLEEIRKFDFTPIVGQYLKSGDHDLWLEDVGAAIEALGGTPFPKFNGGVYFFRKSEFAAQVFAEAAGLRLRAAELGIKDFDRSGPGEETLIGLALSHLRVTKLYYDQGLLMRTPLNSKGPIVLDVLRGKCTFVKEGVRVSPAICHFCGEWIGHRKYLAAGIALRTGKNPSVAWRLSANMRAAAPRVIRRLRKLVA